MPTLLKWMVSAKNPSSTRPNDLVKAIRVALRRKKKQITEILPESRLNLVRRIGGGTGGVGVKT